MEKKLENVTTLHDKKSPHDFLYRGKMVHFELKSMPEFVAIRYFMLVEVTHPLTGQKLEHEETLFVKRIQLKWWEKALGFSYERKIKKAIKQYRKYVADVEEAERRGDALLKKLEDLKQ